MSTIPGLGTRTTSRAAGVFGIVGLLRSLVPFIYNYLVLLKYICVYLGTYRML